MVPGCIMEDMARLTLGIIMVCLRRLADIVVAKRS